MTQSPLQIAIRRAMMHHAAALPVWAARIAIDRWQSGGSVLVKLLLDAILIVVHRRANRMVERVDYENFGQAGSWTKAFYLPEAICIYLVVRDLFNAGLAAIR